MGKPKNPKNPSSEPEQRRLPKKTSNNWNERGKGTPPLVKVHEAFRDKHISLEEAKDLNPKYTGIGPSTLYNRKRNQTKSPTLAVVDDKGKIGKKPKLLDVKKAHTNKKVTTEEAKDLNPHFGSGAPIKRISKVSTVPQLTDVHRAVANKHIDVEQAVDLNPKYANKNSRTNASTGIAARGDVIPRVAHFAAEMKKIKEGY